MSTHLDPNLLAAIKRESNTEGVFLHKLEKDIIVEIKTLNSTYTVKCLGNEEFELTGGTRFREPTKVKIPGSTYGGSTLRFGGYIGNQMFMEIVVKLLIFLKIL